MQRCAVCDTTSMDEPDTTFLWERRYNGYICAGCSFTVTEALLDFVNDEPSELGEPDGNLEQLEILEDGSVASSEGDGCC